MVAIVGLQRRGTRYSVRVRVPEELRPIFRKREITKALGTADKRQAVERLHAVRSEISCLFRAARLKLAMQHVKTEGLAAPCSASAPMRHLGLVEEWRIFGSA